MRARTKKDEYLEKIIHDLKTPASAQIKALEQFLEKSSGKISQEEKELIELTLNSCNYMQNLIETFSAVNKLEHDKIHLHYTRFKIMELINEIMNELKVLIKYHGLKISVNGSKDIIINADKLQLKRVIENILSNAINHSFKDTEITIDAIEYRGKLKVQIRNSSPHLKPGVLKEIFEKFKTKANAYTGVGTGLGLYLSKEIIHAHFGTMIAESFPDNVNVFGFEIPIE